MKYGSLSRRDERKRTLDTRIYLVVRIVTKASLRPCCWSTHVEYCFRQFSSMNTITVILIPLFTKELAHNGSPRPPYKIVDTASHQAGGSLTYRRATRLQGGQRTDIHDLVHSKTSHKAQHLALTLSQELILALTLTKLMLSLKVCSICTWVAWRCFSKCMRCLWSPASFKWSGWGIYITLQLKRAVNSFFA